MVALATGYVSMINILFFAQTRERLNCENLQLEVESGLHVSALKSQLQQKNELWHEVFSSDLLCAVNQALVPSTHVIDDGDEVAFFPPVTGG